MTSNSNSLRQAYGLAPITDGYRHVKIHIAPHASVFDLISDDFGDQNTSLHWKRCEVGWGCKFVDVEKRVRIHVRERAENWPYEGWAKVKFVSRWSSQNYGYFLCDTDERVKHAEFVLAIGRDIYVHNPSSC